MAAVRSTGNLTTEVKFAAALRLHRVTGWRRRQPIHGKPDFVFPKLRVAIFIDGCFWHGCSRHCRMPKSRTEFWTTKIQKNKDRDRAVNRMLRKQGWTVIRIWEHSVPDSTRVVARTKAALAIGALRR